MGLLEEGDEGFGFGEGEGAFDEDGCAVAVDFF